MKRDMQTGFTLLELLVAIMIFTMVMATLYMVLEAGVGSFDRGQESMEIYQGARIGVARMGKDLRKAISPESPWSNQEYVKDDNQAQRFDEFGDPIESEEEENDIIFQGDETSVTFVVEVSILSRA